MRTFSLQRNDRKKIQKKKNVTLTDIYHLYIHGCLSRVKVLPVFIHFIIISVDMHIKIKGLHILLYTTTTLCNTCCLTCWKLTAGKVSPTKSLWVWWELQRGHFSRVVSLCQFSDAQYVLRPNFLQFTDIPSQ